MYNNTLDSNLNDDAKGRKRDEFMSSYRSQFGTVKQRMAGDMLKEFASNTSGTIKKNTKDGYRNEIRNKPKGGGVMSVMGGENSQQQSTGPVAFKVGKAPSKPAVQAPSSTPAQAPSQVKASKNNSDNSTNGMAGYVAPKPKNWSAQKPDEYQGFTGGEAGVDSPDLNYGQIITSPSGTKTQYGADGSMRTYGTDEALASAVQAKKDAEYSVTNYRPIDYSTNLPDNFDPGGKDQLAHKQYLCSLGVQSFCDQAQALQKQYG